MPSKTERVRLLPEQIKVLEQFASDNGMTKSEVIRKALQAYIAEFPDENISQGKRTDKEIN